MQPSFSFNYGGKFFESKNMTDALISDGYEYKLDENVTVTVNIKEYPEYNASEWLLYFENNGDKNSDIISDIYDCDAFLPLKHLPMPEPGYMPKEGDLCVVTMNGMVPGKYYWENDKISATEYGFNVEYLDYSKKITKSFANIGGRSSDGMMPFFDVTSNGTGFMAAIGWTGDWKADFTGVEDGVLIKTGLKNTHFYLKPGEKIRTSSILLMNYTAEEDKSNKFRRLIADHYSHISNTKATREGLLGFELWGGMPSEEIKRRIAELHDNAIGFEDIWIDAGWYGNCTYGTCSYDGDWYEYTGDWYVNKKFHPEEFNDVAAAAKEAGVGLMLWVEPERAIKTTNFCKAHPDWFISIPDVDSVILNYGIDEAAEYVMDLLDGFIGRLNLSCYRQDFNTDLTPYFEKNDEPDRTGITEIKHIMGMYRIWDHILEKFPGLLIDNCSSGGRRIDIETLKRSIAFFRTDYLCNFNENPEVLQTHTANMAYYLPFGGCTAKIVQDTYNARSSYSTSWGCSYYNTVLQTMSEDDFKWAKKTTDEYRSLRKYMSKNFYNHGSCNFDDTAWAIWQYHDDKTQSGILMAFRRSASPNPSAEVVLKGLLSGRTYEFTNLDDGTVFESCGKILIELAEKRSCTILEYKIK